MTYFASVELSLFVRESKIKQTMLKFAIKQGDSCLIFFMIFHGLGYDVLSSFLFFVAFLSGLGVISTLKATESLQGPLASIKRRKN